MRPQPGRRIHEGYGVRARSSAGGHWTFETSAGHSAVGRSAQSVAGDGGRGGFPPSSEVKGGSPIAEVVKVLQVELHVWLDTLEVFAAGR